MFYRMSNLSSKELLGLIVGKEQLSTYFAIHETQDARTSNYSDIVGPGMHRWEVTVHCDECEGTGMRLLSKTRMAEYSRRIAASSNPSRIREDMSKEAQCGVCEGSGRVTEYERHLEMDSMFNTIECPGCRKKLKADKPLCTFPGCAGEGHVIPVTVRETGCSKGGKLPDGAQSFTGGDDFGASGLSLGDVKEDRLTALSMERWFTDLVEPRSDRDVAHEEFETSFDQLRHTGSTVDRVRAADPEAAAALAEYYGAPGDLWAATKWGRIFALWPLTSSGKQIAEEYAEQGSKELRGAGWLVAPVDRIATVRNQESTTKTPNIHWRALIREADGAARDLMERADRLLREAQ